MTCTPCLIPTPPLVAPSPCSSPFFPRRYPCCAFWLEFVCLLLSSESTGRAGAFPRSSCTARWFATVLACAAVWDSRYTRVSAGGRDGGICGGGDRLFPSHAAIQARGVGPTAARTGAICGAARGAQAFVTGGREATGAHPADSPDGWWRGVEPCQGGCRCRRRGCRGDPAAASTCRWRGHCRCRWRGWRSRFTGGGVGGPSARSTDGGERGGACGCGDPPPRHDGIGRKSVCDACCPNAAATTHSLTRGAVG